MEQATELLRHVALIEFIGLALVTLGVLARDRTRASGWAAVTFSILAIVALAGHYLPYMVRIVPAGWLLRGLIALLLVVPYAIFRFAATFERPPLAVTRAAGPATATVVVLAFLLPNIPSQGHPADTPFLVFRTLVGIQWVFLFSVTASRLWRGGHRQPGVVTRRTRLLAVGSAGMSIPIILGVLGLSRHAGVAFTSQLFSVMAGASFALGLAPPASLKNRWRRPEVKAAQAAIGELVEARNAHEVIAGILPHAAAIVGAVGAELHDSTDSIRLTYGIDPAHPPSATTRVDCEFASGTLSVWTSCYTPFFGAQGLADLGSLAHFVELALQRCRLVAREQEFIANAAHELRTPLTVLAGFATTLAAHGSDLSEEQVRSCISAMERQGSRATRLVNDLLDLAELERAPDPLERRVHEVDELVGSAVLAAPAPPQLALAVHNTPGLAVDVHAGRFEQVLVNLLANAYRYARSRIEVGGVTQNGSVLVWIADDGPGIRADLVPLVFEPFQRGGSNDASGSGLGLAIALRIIEAFDGEIQYVPNQGGGARFEIRLPAVEKSGSSEKSSSSGPRSVRPVHA